MADHSSLDQPGPQSFSYGIDKVVALVRPHGRPGTAFPLALDVADTRRGSAENLHGWFVRLVDKYCQGDPLQVSIEENIALMAKLNWRRTG